jgi:hypothetical protein
MQLFRFAKTFIILLALFTSCMAVAQNRLPPCDTALWKHLKGQDKFVIRQSCITVTGTILSVEIKKDGDEHILLKPDADYVRLLNDRNKKKLQGCLVLEIICANTSAEPEAKAACKGYTNTIAIPKKGDHISATGTLVIDNNHGWIEVHPVSSITHLSK